MKRFTIELPDGFDEILSITAIGHTRGANVLARTVELAGHDGDVLVIRPDVAIEWRKPETGWIPVEERMPETGTRVLVRSGTRALVRDGDFTTIGFFGRHTKKWIEPISGAHLDDVTHWMPLPEPPEV